MRIVTASATPISSSHAQDDRADRPLFRNTRSAHQHPERRRLAEPSAHVVGVVAGLELYARSDPIGQTSDNLIRTRECVINLPSEDLVSYVDRLALATGQSPVPEKKRQWGYCYEPDKFGIAGFTPVGSELVAPPRVRQCPIQMEGVVQDFRPFGKNVSANVFEVQIVKLHVDERLLMGDGPRPRIDPMLWRPLIMSFCRFFGLGGEVHPSRLAESGFMKFVTQGMTSHAADSSSTHEQK